MEKGKTYFGLSEQNEGNQSLQNMYKKQNEEVLNNNKNNKQQVDLQLKISRKNGI